MLQSGSGRGIIVTLLLLFCTAGINAQEVISNVRIERVNASLYTVYYTISQPPESKYNTVQLRILRKRQGQVEEVFAETIMPGAYLQPNRTYRYYWNTDAATVMEGDELQARIILSGRKEPAKGNAAANHPPKANAGEFMEIRLPVQGAVVLNGSRSSDDDGGIVSVQWKQIAGPTNLMISGADSLVSIIQGTLHEGSYAFELTVKDEWGASSTDRVVITVKPGFGAPHMAGPVTPMDSVGVKPSVASVKPPGHLKGGPSNALLNLVVPGLGHYYVSGDHRGDNRKKYAFAITGLYAGALGGGLYFHGKQQQSYTKYRQLADYREYQHDAAGNIIGVRGSNASDAAQYLEDARSASRNKQTMLIAAGSILAVDFIYTLVKGMKNRSAWKKESSVRTGFFIMPANGQVTAGFQLTWR